ncbi:MAG: hypothetical protein MRERV_1c162 [Mycoplasmataceae bacterium RV_VA103A]|nr:MAG: hypothetical protein MRERV_1c162 [Mycoplasmataceae bacterium RV_VA103A]
MISETKTNTINSVLVDNKTTPKSKKEIDKEYYQKNKERKKEQRRERYQQQKEQAELAIKKQFAKYYGAEAIKILMTFKEWTELNKEKKKLWQDFNWTLKDCQGAIKEGLGDIVAIMKLAQVADNLIRDYWETAKSKERNDKRSWNLLDYDQQQKLIRYWAYEKARIENGYIDTAEQLERQSKEYLKDIERAKRHEELGKEYCKCSYCELEKQLRNEVAAERKKIIDDYEKEQKKSGENEAKKVRADCGNCYENKKVDPETGLCEKCEKEKENE